MSTYKVGYFVGSLSSTSINRLLAKALVRLAPKELVMTEIPIKDLPALQRRLRRRLSARGACVEAGDCRGRRGAVRLAGIQPLDPRRPEERHRLGQPSLGPEFLHVKGLRGDRYLARFNWDRGGAAEPARRPVLLQFTAD